MLSVLGAAPTQAIRDFAHRSLSSSVDRDGRHRRTKSIAPPAPPEMIGPATALPLTLAPEWADTGPGVHPMALRASLVALVAGLCLLLAPTHDAAARKFQMSGNWV